MLSPRLQLLNEDGLQGKIDDVSGDEGQLIDDGDGVM